MIVPQHCLVIAKTKHAHGFSDSEKVSLRPHAVGTRAEAISEMGDIVEGRIKLGLRVILSEDDLVPSEVRRMTEMVKRIGATVVSVCGEESLSVVPSDTFTDDYLSKFDGLTVVGDVHGNLEALAMAMEVAKAKNHYVLFLGDIVDYGAGSIEVANVVYETVMNGRGEVVRGNHERKIHMWIVHPHRRPYLSLSDGNKVTTTLIGRLSKKDRRKWEGKFVALWNRSRYVLILKNAVFAHGGVLKPVWGDRPNGKKVNEFALFGEFVIADDKRIKTFKWVDQIPNGGLAVVGHTARSFEAPVIEVGQLGGKAVFLDTGSGKGGILTSMSLKLTEDHLEIVSFESHREKDAEFAKVGET